MTQTWVEASKFRHVIRQLIPLSCGRFTTFIACQPWRAEEHRTGRPSGQSEIYGDRFAGFTLRVQLPECLRDSLAPELALTPAECGCYELVEPRDAVRSHPTGTRHADGNGSIECPPGGRPRLTFVAHVRQIPGLLGAKGPQAVSDDHERCSHV